MHPSEDQEEVVREVLEDDLDKKLVFTSFVSEKFLEMYKNKGIIFETDAKIYRVCAIDSQDIADYCLKFESLSGGKAKKDFMEALIFDTIEQLKNEFKGGTEDIKKNIFKIKKKYGIPTRTEKRCYTEIQFAGDIKVKPIAFFGIKEEERRVIAEIVGKKSKHDPLKLPIYKEAVDYFTGKEPEVAGEE